MLSILLPNTRYSAAAVQASVDDEEELILDQNERTRKRINTITQIVVRSIALKKALWFAKSFGVFLVTSGVKKRVVDVASNMGLCSLYRTIQRLIRKNADA